MSTSEIVALIETLKSLDPCALFVLWGLEMYRQKNRAQRAHVSDLLEFARMAKISRGEGS